MLQAQPSVKGIDVRSFVLLAIGALVGGLFALDLGESRLQHIGRSDNNSALPAATEPPWEPLLTDEEVQRAQGYYGSGTRLRRVAAKLLAGQPIKVVTLGGSVTQGVGATRHDYSYPSRLFQLINASFPHRHHVFINAGIPAVGSTVFAVCVDNLVQRDVDLAFVEFTLNDDMDAAYASAARRNYEHVLRSVLKLDRRPAVVQLHHYAWFFSAGDGVEQGLYQYPAEHQLQVFANYYDMPAVSIRGGIWRQMAAGIEGFKADKVLVPGKISPAGVPIPQASKAERRDFYYSDRMHPSDRGHQMMAEALMGPLRRAAAQAAAPQATAARRRSRHDARLEGEPPPMVPGNYEPNSSFCALQENFKPLMTRTDGFEYLADRPDAATFANQKWGWTGLAPGNWAELEVTVLPGPNDASRASNNTTGECNNKTRSVWLGYLRGYEGMGQATLQCISGCCCASTQLNGMAPPGVRITDMRMHIFKVSPHKQCRIRVTIAKAAGRAPLGGHKIKLMSAFVM